MTTVIETLRQQKAARLKGNLYHRVQIDLTYNSNHIEGSRLTHDQTRFIYETNTIGADSTTALNVDDIVETANHFRCIDMIIDNAGKTLTQDFVKLLHRTLKTGTSDSRKDWFAVGDYKRLANEVGGIETVAPEDVEEQMGMLIDRWNSIGNATFDDILDFHHRFETIHPFQDGNGRVGRLLMFMQCLEKDIVPFIITDELRFFYYRGLQHWPSIPGYLRDTCLTAQDEFKVIISKLLPDLQV